MVLINLSLAHRVEVVNYTKVRHKISCIVLVKQKTINLIKITRN